MIFQRSFSSHLRSTERGFTLVELMISILIGVFLAGGLVTLVGAMKRTSVTQSGLSNLQENERLTMSLIADVIQSAGYWPNPAGAGGTTSNLIFTAITAPVAMAAGQTLYGTHTGAAPGDKIYVRYASGGSSDNVINCTGAGSATATVYTNVFSLVTDPNDTDPAHLILQCALTIGTNTKTVQLANGVTNLQILYGVKSNLAVTGNSIDAYLDAGLMTASLWNQVISVKVTLTFVNPLAGQPAQQATIPFTRIITVMNKAGVAT